MDNEDECFSSQIINGEGVFNGAGLDKFIEQVKMRELGISYAVVAIMGSQSSGKSTLLNHLFHTDFREMNKDDGRSQTTFGIWMARCPGIEPCTIVMDLEGNDGRERGEDDFAFEKQIALFTLAVSDIVLINMWGNDIVREQASHKPLLRTVFQAVLILNSPRKTTLMFVIRDKTRVSGVFILQIPLETLESVLRQDIEKIWDAIPKPEALKKTRLSDFFNIRVKALANYEFKEEEFKIQVAILRNKFFKSIEAGGLAGDRRGVVDASGFSLTAQQMWKVIKENKDLDLPAHHVMVANIRCEEIANENYSTFVENKDWLELKELVESNVVPGFGKKLSSLLAMSLSSYDREATYLDKSYKNAKRKQLQDRLIQLVQPTIESMWEHIISRTLKNFKEALHDALKGGREFDVVASNCTKELTVLFDIRCQDIVIEQVTRDVAKARFTFLGNLTSHIAEVRNAQYEVMVANLRCQKIANEKYSIFVANKDWLKLKELVTSNVVPGFGKKLSSLLAMSLSSYDKEATYLDESCKKEKRKQLQDRLIQLVQPSVESMWEHITYGTMKNFKEALNDAIKGGQEFEVAASNCTKEFTTLFDIRCQDTVVKQEAQDLAKVKVMFLGNLTSHVAEVRNLELKKAAALHEDWLKLKELVESSVVLGFGKKLSSLLAMPLSSYDKEATHIDKSCKNAKRKQLQDRLIQLVQPTIELMWEHTISRTLKNFKEALDDALKGGHEFEVAASNCTREFTSLFDIRCQDIIIEQEAYDLAKVRGIFLDSLTSHITHVRNANLNKLDGLYEAFITFFPTFADVEDK